MGADGTAVAQGLRERAHEWCGRIGDGMVDVLRSRAPRRTGDLWDGIERGDTSDRGDAVVCPVRSTSDHAVFNDTGVGVYGPEGRRIQGRPLLAFDWPAAGGVVIVHSVAGYPGSHYWTEGWQDFGGVVREASG